MRSRLVLIWAFAACGKVVGTSIGPDAAAGAADARPDAMSGKPDASPDAMSGSPDARPDALSGPDAGSPDGQPDAMSGAPDASGEPDAGPPPPTGPCDPPESAPDTSNPTTVVGTGPGTCTEGDLAAAAASGGVITFDCGASATIHVSQTIDLPTDVDTVIDGGGRVTLDGGGGVRILSFNHPDYRTNDVRLTLMRLTLANGKIGGTDAYAPAPAPCSQGFYDGYGGALFVRDGVVLVIGSTFVSNTAELLGPDVGGGAIALQGVKKATIIGSVFRGGMASNGGAIECLNCDLDVYNSRFEDNHAVGHGANSNDAGMCSVVAKNGQHQVGSGGDGGAIVIDGGSDGAHVFCGDVFLGNTAGTSALGGAVFRTPDLAKQLTVFDRCQLDDNRADMGGGGALYMHNTTLRIVASTFHANKARAFGAIQADGTTFDFVNDTFEGNEANAVDNVGGVGGAVALFSGDGAMRNVTFANNTATGFAAAVFGDPILTVDNSLFADNTAANAGAPMQCQLTATGTGNLQFPRGHVIGGSDDAPCVAGITFADPDLGALGDNGGPTTTLLPAAGSPALGIGQSCPPVDQRGVARPASDCTSGAVEGSN
jgi:hypothetical protein